MAVDADQQQQSIAQNESSSPEEMRPSTSKRFSSHSSFEAFLRKKIDTNSVELIELNIPLNDSPSAGLGISLKAQRVYDANAPIDSGLFVRSVIIRSIFISGRR